MNRYHLIIVLAVVVYFSNLGGTSIYILDEAKNAGCAAEMLQRGDLIVPTFNGTLRGDKPPLHYYFMMAAYAVTGVSAFAARFFSAIAGVLLVAVVYRAVRRVIGEPTAFATALIMLTSIQLTVQYHLAVPDPYLIVLLCISMLAFFYGLHYERRYVWAAYAAAALGFLTKGLVAVVLPGLTVLIYLLLTRQFTWATLKRLHVLGGIVLFCGVALPWYVAVGYATDGQWLREFFIGHNLERYTSTMEGHGGFPLAPFVILVSALLPFAVFIVQAVKLAWVERREQPLLLFALTVCVVFAGFFSFSRTILPSYPAPAIPFLAIVVGYFVAKFVEGRSFKGIRASIVVHVVLAVAVAVGGYIALRMEPQLRDLLPVVWIFVPLPVGALIGWYYYNKGKRTAMVYTWAACWILVVQLFFYVANPQLDYKNPVAQSAGILQREYPDRPVVAFKSFNPAYVFNLHKTVPEYHTADSIRNLQTQQKIVVLTRREYAEELLHGTSLRIIYSGKDLFENNESVIMTN